MIWSYQFILLFFLSHQVNLWFQQGLYDACNNGVENYSELEWTESGTRFNSCRLSLSAHATERCKYTFLFEVFFFLCVSMFYTDKFKVSIPALVLFWKINRPFSFAGHVLGIVPNFLVVMPRGAHQTQTCKHKVGFYGHLRQFSC